MAKDVQKAPVRVRTTTLNKMKICLLLPTILFATGSFAAAMTNGDVVRMVQSSRIVRGNSGISIQEIIEKINESQNGFRLFPEDVRYLRKQHVPDVVIDAMFARNVNETTDYPQSPVISQPPLRPGKRVGQRLILREQTPVRLRLTSNLTSSNLGFGDRIEFEVLEDVLVQAETGDKFLVIPREAPAWGTVTAVNKTQLMGHYGTVEVALDAVTLANGDKVALSGSERGDRHIRPGIIVFALAPIGYIIQPKDPIWLAWENRASVIKDGRDFTVSTDGVADLDSAEFVTR